MLTIKNIELGRACSASVDLDVAIAFAGKDAISALFVMKNPNKIGLDAREFSKFEIESEIIIKGSLEVETIYLKSDRVNDNHLDKLGHFAARNFQKGQNLFFVFVGTIK